MGTMFGFLNSPQSGYLQSANFTNSGTLPFLINPRGGNVGIGTSSPLGRLDVTGNANSWTTMAAVMLTDVNSAAASRNWSMRAGGAGYGSFTIGTSAAADGNPNDGTGLNRLTIDASGNVGITGTVTAVKYTSTASNASGPAFSPVANSGMYNAGTNTLGFSTNSAERMRIDSSGNVGIGTIPDDVLTINVSGGSNNVRAIHLVGGPDVTNKYISIGRTHTTSNDHIDSEIRFGAETGGSGTSFIALATGNNNSIERMRVDNYGTVTMPFQPAFHVGCSDTAHAANGHNKLTGMTSERFDQSGDYTNAEFTAPVSGRYQFNWTVRVDGLSNNSAHCSIDLYTSNKQYTYQTIHDMRALDAAPSYWSFRGSSLVDMDAGDKAYLTGYFNNTTGTIEASSSWSGYLVA